MLNLNGTTTLDIFETDMICQKMIVLCYVPNSVYIKYRLYRGQLHESKLSLINLEHC